jgi:radical SAM/Cys-rich protein
MRDTWPLLNRQSDFPSISRERIDTLQLNLGYLCNLSCIHCHVNAGPTRTELMSRETMALALEVARGHDVTTLDLTGGSPEMNPEFRWLVTRAVEQGLHVMDRLNPTIIAEPGFEWVAGFLAASKVEVIASLPCHSADNVDEQRGNGVFDASIDALRALNALGYGDADSGLSLNLVYNPNGAFLPPPQAMLEEEYRHLLSERFGIRFNNLFTLANMPIKRFGSWLLSKGRFDGYMKTLRDAHREENLAAVMCRSLVSVDWQGSVFDCDFNQMLGLSPAAGRLHLRDLVRPEALPRDIAVAGHCFGCTAGQGSSCGGALAD